MQRSETTTFVRSAFISVSVWTLSFCSSVCICCLAHCSVHPPLTIPWPNVPPLSARHVSPSLCLPVRLVIISPWWLSGGRSGSSCTCFGFLSHYLLSAIWRPCTKGLNINVPDTHTHTHTHTQEHTLSVDGCLLGDECVADMVIRKKINMRTQWPSVSLRLVLSVSAARLIHLQLSGLVEQVRGNVVLRRGLNPQSGPTGCRGSDRWSRVTRPGVSGSFCCFVRSLRVLWQTSQRSGFESVQLRPLVAASWGRATCVCSVIETLWSRRQSLCRTNAVLRNAAAAAKNRIKLQIALHKVLWILNPVS